MSQAKIAATPNGSYKVSGPVTVTDVHGRETVVEEGKDLWLCRCGGSKNKPFCDGTHKTNGFSDE